MSKLTRHILYEKFSKEKAAENLFVGFLNDFQIKFSDKHPNVVFYIKNNEVFIAHYKNNDCLWIDYVQIWSVFEKYGCSCREIIDLIKSMVWKHLKINNASPFNSQNSEPLWEHFKLKGI
jgi:hypothetical protein